MKDDVVSDGKSTDCIDRLREKHREDRKEQ